eukprot:2605553-Ditylum_brightwellii.AAC.1
MEACGVKQLYSGLRLDLEDGIHAMDDLWSNFGDKDNWDILLVNAHNAFNRLNHMALLWHVRHVWPSDARYSLDTYHH